MNPPALNDGAVLSPILDYVIIEPRDAFEHESGLVLPEAYDDDAYSNDGDLIRARNQLCLGIVRAVGPGPKHREPKPGIRRRDATGEPTKQWEREPEPERPSQRRPMDVSPGDQVLYHRASALKLDDSDPVLVVVHEPAIYLAVEGSVRQVVGGIVSQ